jgi:hypothetical protein
MQPRCTNYAARYHDLQCVAVAASPLLCAPQARGYGKYCVIILAHATREVIHPLLPLYRVLRELHVLALRPNSCVSICWR